MAISPYLMNILGSIGQKRPVNLEQSYTNYLQNQEQQRKLGLQNQMRQQLEQGGTPTPEEATARLGQYDPVGTLQGIAGVDEKGTKVGELSAYQQTQQENKQKAIDLKRQATALAKTIKSKIKNDPNYDYESDMFDYEQLLSEAQLLGGGRIRNAVERVTKLQNEAKRLKLQVDQDKRDDREFENKIRDKIYDLPKKLGVDKLEGVLIAFDRVDSLYNDALSGQSQSAQQQYVTNMIKLSDGSMVLLSEIDANKAQDVKSLAQSFLQRISAGSRIPPADIKNIYRTAKAIEAPARKTIERKLGAVAKELTTRGLSGKNGKAMTANDVKAALGIGYTKDRGLPDLQVEADYNPYVGDKGL